MSYKLKWFDLTPDIEETGAKCWRSAEGRFSIFKVVRTPLAVDEYVVHDTPAQLQGYALSLESAVKWAQDRLNEELSKLVVERRMKRTPGARFIRPTKCPISAQERAQVREYLKLPLPKGEARFVYRCEDPRCRRIFYNECIPYGLGRGRQFNACVCVCVSANARTQQLGEVSGPVK